MARLAVILLLTSATVPWPLPTASPDGSLFVTQDPEWHEGLDADVPIGFFIAPDDAEDSAATAGDAQLAHWALDAWETAAAGRLELVPAPPDRALTQLYWVAANEGLYGEMRPFVRGAQRGAVVFVLPDTRGLGQAIHRRARRDPLFRDTVIYLTCLHELGHAFGLGHTADYDDIMYSFAYGGDILGYFQRYRDRIRTRDDIAAKPGLSQPDVARLRALYEQSP